MEEIQILVVEDEPINLEILLAVLQGEGYRTTPATTGSSAWQLLNDHPERFDLVLLDRMMPDMDGIELLRNIKDHPSLVHTPVIMQTSVTGESAIAEGLSAGAYYYLTKPFSADTLLAIVAAAERDLGIYNQLRQAARQTTHALRHLSSAEFRFRTLSDARDLATVLANVTPDPERTVLGLSELMLNAVEHGNLGISYHEKSLLIRNNSFTDEVDRRLSDPTFANKQVVVHFKREPDALHFVITDQGNGFEWQRYLEFSPDRAFDLHGRGIAMANKLSFDHIQYIGCGNTVEAIVHTA